MKNRPGYMVVELNHSGIPDKDLAPEEFSPLQEQVLAGLDAHIQEKVRRGCPIAVVDLESSERVCEIQEFYADPKNVQKFEEWKKKHNKKK